MRNGTEIEIKLTLIRHGATKSNQEYRYLGKTDEALSEEGRKDLIARKEKGLYPVPKKLFASPMLRCRQTAEILFPDMRYQCIPEWTEIDFGLFEGKNHCELNGNQRYQQWIDSNGTLPFPGGEGRREFIERMLRGFARLLSHIREPGNAGAEPAAENITAIVHGGTIMALCSVFFGGDYYDYQVGCGQGFEGCFKYSAGSHADAVQVKKI